MNDRKFPISITLYLIFILLIVQCSLFIVSCSPKVSHNLLTFFFDGVPPIGGQQPVIIRRETVPKKDSATLASKDITMTPKGSFHPPYANNKCNVCHDKEQMGKVLMPLPALCFKCHDEFEEKYPVKHGPVASGYCTACHSPHFTKNEKLLLRTGQQICLYCHNSKDILNNDEAHKDIGDTKCTDCHNPHGGKDRFMLN
jgi:predicted CXXCH cytochrome family protein